MRTIILKLKLWIIHVIECFTMRQNRGYIVVFANTDKYEYPTTEIHVCKSYYQATRILKGEEEILKNEIKPQEYQEIDDWFGVTDKYGNQTTGEIFSIEMLLNRSINIIKQRKEIKKCRTGAILSMHVLVSLMRFANYTTQSRPTPRERQVVLRMALELFG